MTWQELERYIRDTAAYLPPSAVKVAGVNFITPDVVTTRKVAGRLIELSYGTAFGEGGWVIGVSVRPDTANLSRCIHDPEELPAVLADIVETLTGAGVS